MGSANSARTDRIPRAAIIIDTSIAILLVGIGIYHFTQPNEAWRSGIVELLCSTLLLLAVHRVSSTKAMVINLVVAVPVFSFSIRHLIHGGGWRSGITELLFAALLVTAARIIHRGRAG